MRPRLLDLYCGAGGASMGYARAGYEVVGVDLAPQPRYPFEFHQDDALTFPLDSFDVIHASPPCQAYSVATVRARARGVTYPDLIAPTRERLEASGLHWVLENVPGAPIRADAVLCGCHFGLPGLRRPRWFETNWPVVPILRPHSHQGLPVTVAGHGAQGWEYELYRAAGLPVPRLAERKLAMGIDWMNRDELGEAIPPAYTQFLGEQLLAALGERAA